MVFFSILLVERQEHPFTWGHNYFFVHFSLSLLAFRVSITTRNNSVNLPLLSPSLHPPPSQPPPVKQFVWLLCLSSVKPFQCRDLRTTTNPPNWSCWCEPPLFLLSFQGWASVMPRLEGTGLGQPVVQQGKGQAGFYELEDIPRSTVYIP